MLWCVRQDGVLLGLSYVPEQKIAAWFEYKTDGAFESAAVVQEGLNDYLYAVVRRTVNGQTRRFVERQMVRTDDYRGATCFLDCAGRLTSSAKSMDVSGLSWLEGRVVTAVGDGIVFSGLTVKDGKVTLPQECADVWVGAPLCDGAEDASRGASVAGRLLRSRPSEERFARIASSQQNIGRRCRAGHRAHETREGPFNGVVWEAAGAHVR